MLGILKGIFSVITGENNQEKTRVFLICTNLPGVVCDLAEITSGLDDSTHSWSDGFNGQVSITLSVMMGGKAYKVPLLINGQLKTLWLEKLSKIEFLVPEGLSDARLELLKKEIIRRFETKYPHPGGR